MHVVVVGCGRVGSELAGSLQASGHTVSVIDKTQDSFRRLGPAFGGRTIVGYGFDHRQRFRNLPDIHLLVR